MTGAETDMWRCPVPVSPGPGRSGQWTSGTSWNSAVTRAVLPAASVPAVAAAVSRARSARVGGAYPGSRPA